MLSLLLFADDNSLACAYLCTSNKNKNLKLRQVQYLTKMVQLEGNMQCDILSAYPQAANFCNPPLCKKKFKFEIPLKKDSSSLEVIVYNCPVSSPTVEFTNIFINKKTYAYRKSLSKLYNFFVLSFLISRHISGIKIVSTYSINIILVD